MARPAWSELRGAAPSGLRSDEGARRVDGASRRPAGERQKQGPPRPATGRISSMAELKDRLRADLTASMKDRDEVRTRTLRMVLTEIAKEEVSGATSRELDDAEVERVVAREAKRRREAAEAFGGAGRADQATAELAEGKILAGYLPSQLDDAELAALVRSAISQIGATGPGAM